MGTSVTDSIVELFSRVSANQVSVSLSEGSVAVNVQITGTTGTTPETIASDISANSANLQSAVAGRVNQIQGLPVVGAVSVSAPTAKVVLATSAPTTAAPTAAVQQASGSKSS